MALSFIAGGTFNPYRQLHEGRAIWYSLSELQTYIAVDSSSLINGYTWRHAKQYICKIIPYSIILIVSGNLKSQYLYFGPLCS